jgi:hypothetical protein
MLAFDREAAACCRFTGNWLAVLIPPCARWPGPKYGILRGRHEGREWNLRDAQFEIFIDGSHVQTVSVLDAPLETVVACGLPDGEHTVECRFALRPGACGALAGFVFGMGNPAGVAVTIHGDYESALNTVRLTLEDEHGKGVTKIGRNPLSARAGIIILDGGTYRLKAQANGWESCTTKPFQLVTGDTVDLPPIYLRRAPDDAACEGYGIVHPSLGQSISIAPGTSFSAFLRIAGGATADAVSSATLTGASEEYSLSIQASSICEQFTNEHGLQLRIPDTVPDGLYDLRIAFADWTDTAPSAVMVRRQIPDSFRILYFGHTNTWEQETAEYIDQLVDIANRLDPLFVIVSNEVNGAYLSGCLRRLRMPCFVTTGNHSYPGFSRFFGPAVAAYDCGPCRVLNFGRPWSDEWRHAVHLLEDSPSPPIRIINAYEPDAPVEGLLDRCQVQLLFAGHAMGSAEPSDSTLIVGKANANSFRIVAVDNGVPRLITCPDEPQGAFPVPRDAADSRQLVAAVEAALNESIGS